VCISIIKASVRLGRLRSRNRSREVNVGGGADRPEGVVGHEVDVVRLAPPSHLGSLINYSSAPSNFHWERKVITDTSDYQ
jgi:hypothetical protein